MNDEKALKEPDSTSTLPRSFQRLEKKRAKALQRQAKESEERNASWRKEQERKFAQLEKELRKTINTILSEVHRLYSEGRTPRAQQSTRTYRLDKEQIEALSKRVVLEYTRSGEWNITWVLNPSGPAGYVVAITIEPRALR